MRKTLSRTAWGLAVVFGLLRLAHWDATLTGDEAYTLQHYAAKTPTYIVTHYEVANNHVLLSLILNRLNALSPKELFLTLERQSVLRLPSYIASVIALALMLLIGRQVLSAAALPLLAVLLGATFWHLIYSQLLRGYSLSALFNLLNVFLVGGVLRRGSKLALIALAFSVAAAHYLVPTNIWMTAALLLWAAILAVFPGYSSYRRNDLLMCAGSVVAGCVISGLLYAPIAKQLLNAAESKLSLWESFAQSGQRLDEMIGAFSLSPVFGYVLFVSAVVGIVSLMRGNPRKRASGLLLALYLAVPFALMTVQRVIAPTRVYSSMLPLWLLAAAAGLYALAAAYVVRQRRPIPRLRFAGIVVAALLAVAASFDVRAFLRWHRGVHIHKALEATLSRTKAEDDFVLILTTLGEAQGLVDVLSWEYSAIAAARQLQVRIGADFPYLLRRRYYVLATDEQEAHKALERSALDSRFRTQLKHEERVGSLGLYSVNLHDSFQVLTDAAKSGDDASRARALTGLAAIAIGEGKFEEAIGLLKRSGALRSDTRTTYLLAYAHYLSLEYAAAGDGFARVVASDPGNIHARLYLADTLLWRQRFPEAMQAYSWFFSSGKTIDAWLLSPRAALAIAAVKSGRARLVFKPVGASGWEKLASATRELGQYEIAELALRKSVAYEPTPQRLIDLAYLNAVLGRHVEAVINLRSAIARGAEATARLRLVDVLILQRSLDEARVEMGELLKANSSHPEVLALRDRLDRL